MEEKEINVLGFDSLKNSKGKTETQEDYFSKYDLRVTRGELGFILQKIMGNIDAELMTSFKNVVSVVNLSEILVQALTDKGLISSKDLEEAKKVLIKELDIKKEEK